MARGTLLELIEAADENGLYDTLSRFGDLPPDTVKLMFADFLTFLKKAPSGRRGSGCFLTGKESYGKLFCMEVVDSVTGKIYDLRRFSAGEIVRMKADQIWLGKRKEKAFADALWWLLMIRTSLSKGPP